MKSRFVTCGFWITLLFLTFMLGAYSPSLSSSDAVPYPSEISTANPNIEITPLTSQIDQPTITSAPDETSCGYQWAYQNLPELTTQLQQTLQMLKPHAQVRAYAFGEDCVHADGSRNFLAMETDFDVTLQINDLTNEDELGTWVVRVMQAILSIPKDQIQGPRPRRVSINFQSGNQNQGISFYIDQYQTLPAGLSNAEIYQKLKTPQ